TDAPAQVINTATVTGGGDPTTHTDTDPTTITSVTPDTPVLAIDKSHTGDFAQGQQGATYTLTAGNSASSTVPTDGTTVTVTDTLPTGLTVTGISGTGWTCTLATLTCTRSDALAAGSTYPPITVTVDVATDAPAQVINTATVTGGGDPTTHTDTDPTTITSQQCPPHHHKPLLNQKLSLGTTNPCPPHHHKPRKPRKPHGQHAGLASSPGLLL
ncbi:hypothetical protein ACFYXH_41640, partial [Streptomyces sp. NPDC002730]